jgi:hypothetical protein
MKQRTLQFITAVCLLMAANASVAGPLDRLPDARTNPAVDDMLRIPGVVGQTKTEACMTLQQAGLNPVVHILTGESAQYKGMECQVVKQSPLPGGVAMIGASVEIDVYAPTDCVDQIQGDAYQQGMEGDGAQWSEGSDNNWALDGNVEDDPAAGVQSGGLMQQDGRAQPQVEEQSEPPNQQKKKINWKPLQRSSVQKPSSPSPRPGTLKERKPAPGDVLKDTNPIKGEEDR